MPEKIFKSIFRLDFPLAYKILDKLGEYLEIIDKQATEPPFTKGNGNVDLLQHSLTYNGKVGDDAFTLTLDLKTFNGVIEFLKGCDIGELARFPLFNFADELIHKLDEDHVSKYDRIGFRSLIIIEEKNFKFRPLRDYIWKLNSIFGDALSDFFEEREDIGLVFESKEKDNSEYVRLRLGPYQKNERLKYFEATGDIEEGMILDIDMWQRKVSIPKLKLTEMVNQHQKIYGNLVGSIKSKLQEVLK
jgi:hypothetical protein